MGLLYHTYEQFPGSEGKSPSLLMMPSQESNQVLLTLGGQGVAGRELPSELNQPSENPSESHLARVFMEFSVVLQ